MCEGEPEDSFPEVMLKDGAEPLAADVRDDSVRGRKKLIKAESLRILAPMLGVDYDDLKQRNRERYFKKVVSIAAAIIAVLIAFLAYVSYTSIEISRQSDIIKENQAPFELVLHDYSGYVAVWDYATFSKVFETYDGIVGYDDSHIAGFIDADTIFYINAKGHVTIYDFRAQKVKAVLSDDDFTGVFAGAEGKYLAALNDRGIYVYSPDDCKFMYYNSLSAEGTGEYRYSPFVMLDEDTGRVVFSISKNKSGGVIAVADVIHNSLIYSFKHKNGTLEYATGRDRVIYCLSHEEDNEFSATTLLAFDPIKKETLWESDFNGKGTMEDRYG